MAMRDFVKLFKALSDEIRIRILKVLLERECCVCEVMQALNISPVPHAIWAYLRTLALSNPRETAP